ncbi:MAG: TraR/DksA family transcriptional regulator [Chthoniobacterales bacterium]
MTQKKISSKKQVSKAAKPASKELKKAISKKKVEKNLSKNTSKLKVLSQKSSRSTPQKHVATKSATKVIKKVEQPTQIEVSISKKKKHNSPAAVSQTHRGALQQKFVTKPLKQSNQKLDPFLTRQRQRLLQLKDMLLDSMSGVARGNLRSGCDASAFGMHQADAGSDAYDRDFALSILSQEQNSLYEIDEALKRIDDGTYGICEISNKPILRARLEARPFTRYTVECQAELEKRQHVSGTRLPVSALFGITEEENENEDEEEEEESFVDTPKD